jgi:hypothetical protein
MTFDIPPVILVVHLTNTGLEHYAYTNLLSLPRPTETLDWLYVNGTAAYVCFLDRLVNVTVANTRIVCVSKYLFFPYRSSEQWMFFIDFKSIIGSAMICGICIRKRSYNIEYSMIKKDRLNFLRYIFWTVHGM